MTEGIKPAAAALLRRRAAEAAVRAVGDVLDEAGADIASVPELAAEALLLGVSIACGPHEAARMIAYCSPRHWEG